MYGHVMSCDVKSCNVLSCLVLHGIALCRTYVCICYMSVNADDIFTYVDFRYAVYTVYVYNYTCRFQHFFIVGIYIYMYKNRHMKRSRRFWILATSRYHDEIGSSGCCTTNSSSSASPGVCCAAANSPGPRCRRLPAQWRNGCPTAPER